MITAPKPKVVDEEDVVLKVTGSTGWSAFPVRARFPMVYQF